MPSSHLPFSRGGKFSAGQRDGGDFAMVVGIERFGATGGASCIV